MTEAVVEKVEVEAEAEEVFEFWSDLKNVCALVQTAEESRRVDLSESLWSFRGPAGRSADFGPDAFRGCLRHRRWGQDMVGASSPDLVLGNVFVDFKPVSRGKTLLFLRYAAGKAGAEGRAPDEGAPSEFPQELYLNLHAILTNLYREAYEARDASEAPTPDGVISLLEEWDAEDPAYDEQTLSGLKENLDRNRPEYRKIFGRG